MLSDTFIAFSTETTGLIKNTPIGPVYPEIVSFGAVLVIQGSVVDSMNVICRPKGAIETEATRINGATAKTLESYPHFDEVAADILNYLDPSIPLVTHAAIFHWHVLVNQFQNVGLSIENTPPLCIGELCKTSDRADGPMPRLDWLANLAGLDLITQVDNRLDASVDARSIADVALYLKREFQDVAAAS